MTRRPLAPHHRLNPSICCFPGPQVDQNNYPEMLGKTAIINAGAVINFVFPFVKPFLDKRTVNKIEVRAAGAARVDKRGHVCRTFEFKFRFVKPFLDKRTMNKIEVGAAAGFNAGICFRMHAKSCFGISHVIFASVHCRTAQHRTALACIRRELAVQKHSCLFWTC